MWLLSLGTVATRVSALAITDWGESRTSWAFAVTAVEISRWGGRGAPARAHRCSGGLRFRFRCLRFPRRVLVVGAGPTSLPGALPSAGAVGAVAVAGTVAGTVDAVPAAVEGGTAALPQRIIVGVQVPPSCCQALLAEGAASTGGDRGSDAVRSAASSEWLSRATLPHSFNLAMSAGDTRSATVSCPLVTS